MSTLSALFLVALSVSPLPLESSADSPALAQIRATLEQGETLEAIHQVEQLHQNEGGESAESNYLLGLALQRRIDEVGLLSKRKVSRQLKESLTRALELDPGHVGAHEELADFYFFAPGIVGGSKKKATAQIDALERVSPVDADRVRGRHAYNSGDFADAETFYSQALSRDSSQAELWYLRGLARRQRLEKDQAALSDFDRALELGYEEPMLHYQVGRLCVRLESCAERGERSLRMFIDQSEGRLQAFGHYRLAQLLEQARRLEDARTEARAALALEPKLEAAAALLERVEDALSLAAP